MSIYNHNQLPLKVDHVPFDFVSHYLIREEKQIKMKRKLINKKLTNEMDNLHVRLTFNLGKINKIFYYS